MSKVCKTCGYDGEELINEIKNLKNEFDIFTLKNAFKYQNCMEIPIAKIFEERDILLQALRLACNTLATVCMTQNYTLGIGQGEKYFIKKAKEILNK